MVENTVAQSADEIEATKRKDGVMVLLWSLLVITSLLRSSGSSITETVQPDSNKPGFPPSVQRCDASELIRIISKVVMYVVERN
jgi:hypothetical protein